MDANIKHDKDTGKFFADLDGKTARLEYKMRGDNTIDFLSTYVPREYRNQGIAKQLAEKGLSYAKSKNLEVIPTCSYIQSFIEQNEEYQNLVKGEY